MADFILIDEDKAEFLPAFTPATVIVKPGKLEASGAATIDGKKMCVAGDEAKLSVPGCVYMTPQFSIPGKGTLKISALAGNQRAQKTTTGGKMVLLKGSQFTAKLEVETPAKQPPPAPGAPVPDSTREYSGKGMFKTTNAKFRGE